MPHPGRALALLALLAAGGCVKLDSYNCAQSSECQNGDVLGTCELAGVCSFPDAGCPSGKKYGELAGEQSGQCVGMVADTTGAPTTSPTGPATTDVSSTIFDPGASTTFDPTTTMTSEVTTPTTGATTTTGDATLTGEPGTTTGDGPACGEIGAACVQGECCGGCARCDTNNVCSPAAGDQDPCGVCSLCGDDGECTLAAVGTDCPADCSDIVWKEVLEPPLAACYVYGPMPAMGACDEEGRCTPPDPAMAGCPEPALEDANRLAQCEIVCKEEDNPCIPGEPASAVDMASYCLVRNSSPACTTKCSADGTFLDPASCVDGVCVHAPPEECGPYVCDPVTPVCLAECMTNENCAAPAMCMGGQCM